MLKMRTAWTMRFAQGQAHVLLRIAEDKMPQRNREFLRAFCLLRRRNEVALLPYAQRASLSAQFLIIYLRALPLAFRSVLLRPT
jgi:hypothetical protein